MGCVIVLLVGILLILFAGAIGTAGGGAIGLFLILLLPLFILVKVMEEVGKAALKKEVEDSKKAPMKDYNELLIEHFAAKREAEKNPPT